VNEWVKKKYRKPRLFYPREYQKFPWFADVKLAKARKEELEFEFDLPGQRQERKDVINRELEFIDDYFDWLQMVGD
jgi:hypothetical protein